MWRDIWCSKAKCGIDDVRGQIAFAVAGWPVCYFSGRSEMKRSNPLLGDLAGKQMKLCNVTEPAAGVYLIGELSKAFGIEATAIRFYEKAGLINPDRVGKLRIYRRQDVERLAAIIYLRALNVPMIKVKQLLDGPETSANILAGQLRLIIENAEFMTRRIAEVQTALAAASPKGHVPERS
jgi:DNA-binding transcriptional MerR regulator